MLGQRGTWAGRGGCPGRGHNHSLNVAMGAPLLPTPCAQRRAPCAWAAADGPTFASRHWKTPPAQGGPSAGPSTCPSFSLKCSEPLNWWQMEVSASLSLRMVLTYSATYLSGLVIRRKRRTYLFYTRIKVSILISFLCSSVSVLTQSQDFPCHSSACVFLSVYGNKKGLCPFRLCCNTGMMAEQH